MTRKKIGILVASFIVFVATLTTLGYEGTKKTVALTIDGEEMVVKTHASTVGDVLSDLQVSVKDDDFLSHSLDTTLKNQLNVVWEPAMKVAVLDNKEETFYWTTAKTVKEFLEEKQIKVGEHDKTDFTLADPLKSQIKLKIERAFPLVVENGNDKNDVWATSTTVADFLQEQQIELGELDYVEPKLEEEIKPNGVVKITRVEKVTDVVEEAIDYKTVTKKDANLLQGTEKVVQAGKEGLLKKEFEVTKENGKEVDRKLVAENTVEESQSKIVAVGTKVIVAQASRGKQKASVQTQSAPASAPQGGKEMYMNATAYTAYCNGCSGVTATGINLRANPNLKVIAVDPSVIPLGTKVWVDGYGYAVAGDTGGAIKGNRIDLFVPTKDQAYRYGRKQVKVRILN